MTNEREPMRAPIGTSLMKETILLLASETVIRKAIREALQSEGYYVLEAHDLSSAAELLKSREINLLIVRHLIENVPGHEAAMYLRSIRPGLPVLIVGGILDDPSLEYREILHNFGIFPKPYKAAELLAEVKEILLKWPPRERPGHQTA